MAQNTNCLSLTDQTKGSEFVVLFLSCCATFTKNWKIKVDYLVCAFVASLFVLYKHKENKAVQFL